MNVKSMKIKRFNENSNIKLDINNESDVDKIMKLIEDQSWEWAWGQVSEQGEERKVVSESFIEGARTVISILQGDEYLISLLSEISK